MRFYLDEDLSPRVAEIARARCGLDVLSAHETGAFGWDDAEQLRFAARAGRCMVTRNRDDFILETAAAFEARASHAGLLILTRSLPNNQFAAIAMALCAYASRHPDGMQAYTVDFLGAALGME